MKKTIASIFLVVMILIIFVYFQDKSFSPQVCIKSICFEVELAKTPEERKRGLMYRDSLELDKGMLFIFHKEDYYGFWMKNTLIPLDIIWISENKEIVYMSKNTLPCELDPCPSYNPEFKALYVLEIKGGLSEKYNFNNGDSVEFKNMG